MYAGVPLFGWSVGAIGQVFTEMITRQDQEARKLNLLQILLISQSPPYDAFDLV
jgi:hypothetical protein